MNKGANKLARWVVTLAVGAVFLSATGYGFHGGAVAHWEFWAVVVGLGLLFAWPDG